MRQVKLYTVLGWDFVEYGAFMGVYTTAAEAYRAACVAANSVVMFVNDLPFTDEDVSEGMTENGDHLILKGENDLEAKVMLTVVEELPASGVAFPVFEMIYEGLRQYMGTFTTPLLAYQAATRATKSVMLFDVEAPYSAEDLAHDIDLKKENIILTGENDLMAIVMYAPLNFDFITKR